MRYVGYVRCMRYVGLCDICEICGICKICKICEICEIHEKLQPGGQLAVTGRWSGGGNRLDWTGILWGNI